MGKKAIIDRFTDYEFTTEFNSYILQRLVKIRIS